MKEQDGVIQATWKATYHALGAQKAAGVTPLGWFAHGWQACQQQADAHIEGLQTALANARAANEANLLIAERAERERNTALGNVAMWRRNHEVDRKAYDQALAVIRGYSAAVTEAQHLDNLWQGDLICEGDYTPQRTKAAATEMAASIDLCRLARGEEPLEKWEERS